MIEGYLARCPLPSCGGPAQDLSTTNGEQVMCTQCGLTLAAPNAVDAWNDRPARVPAAVALGILERVRARMSLPAEDLAPNELAALLELSNGIAAYVTPSDQSEPVNVGVGLWVHGEPEAASVLRNRLATDPEEQVPEPLRLLQAAEQAGFVFEGHTYRCSLPDIARLLAIVKGTP